MQPSKHRKESKKERRETDMNLLDKVLVIALTDSEVAVPNGSLMNVKGTRSWHVCKLSL